MNGNQQLEKRKDVRIIFFTQIMLLCGFCVFALGVIIWIIHLVNVSIDLKDVPSASVGISIVAIPLFLVIAGVVNFVFWGLLLDKDSKNIGVQ